MKKAFFKISILLLLNAVTFTSICSAQPPPDCPECIPDPGGGTEDTPGVPLDDKMLVFLFAGAAYIVVKHYQKANKNTFK